MPTSTKGDAFPGFRNPTTTPVPDEVFDVLMPDLTGAELKVLLYICRRTFGFKKEFDAISLSQMVNGIVKKNGEVLDSGTGLGKGSVARAVAALEEKGVILRTKRRTAEKGDQPTTYALRMAPVSQNGTPRVLKSVQGGVPKPDTQVTVNNKQLDNTVNGGKSPVGRLPDLDQTDEQTEQVAHEILQELGDGHSRRFYRLVAASVPYDVIRRALSEIKTDGAEHPARVFTYRMNEYALKRLKKRIGESAN